MRLRGASFLPVVQCSPVELAALKRKLEEALGAVRAAQRVGGAWTSAKREKAVRAAEKGLSRALVDLVPEAFAALPDKFVVEIGKAAALTRPLDYGGAEVLLRVTSRSELRTRLRSCAKEPWTVRWIEEFVRPADVLFDIGANVGAYALVAAKHTEGGARIFAFEPGPATYAALCANVVLNRCEECVVPLPVALAATTGIARFELTDIDPGKALHALVASDGGAAAARAAGVVRPHRHFVAAFALDDLRDALAIPAPTHVKLDVDGAELDVLRGARRTLSEPALRSLMVEVDERAPEAVDELFAVLRESGFKLLRRETRAAPEEAAEGEREHAAVSYCLFTRAAPALP